MLLTLFANHPLIAGTADAKDGRQADADPAEHSFAVILAETETGPQGEGTQLADMPDADATGTLSDDAEGPEDEVDPERDGWRPKADADAASSDIETDRPAVADRPLDAGDRVETSGGDADTPLGLPKKDLDPQEQSGVTAIETDPQLGDNDLGLVRPGGPDAKQQASYLPSDALADKIEGQIPARQRPAVKGANRRPAVPEIANHDRPNLPRPGHAAGKGQIHLAPLPEAERIGDAPVSFTDARPDPRIALSPARDDSLPHKARHSDRRPVEDGDTQTEKPSVWVQGDPTGDRTLDPRIVPKTGKIVDHVYPTAAQGRLERNVVPSGRVSELSSTGAGSFRTNHLGLVDPTGEEHDVIGRAPTLGMGPRFGADRQALDGSSATARATAIPASQKGEGRSGNLLTGGRVIDADGGKVGDAHGARMSLQMAQPDPDANNGKFFAQELQSGTGKKSGDIETDHMAKSDSIAPKDGKRRPPFDPAQPDQDKHVVLPKHDTRTVTPDPLAGIDVRQKGQAIAGSGNLEPSVYPQPKDSRAKREMPIGEPIKVSFLSRKDTRQRIVDPAGPVALRSRDQNHEGPAKPVGKTIDGVVADRLPTRPVADLARPEAKDPDPNRLSKLEPQPVQRTGVSRSVTKDVPIQFTLPKEKAQQHLQHAAQPEAAPRPDNHARPVILKDKDLSGQRALEPGNRDPSVKDAQTIATRPLVIETTGHKRPNSLPQDLELQSHPRSRIVWDRTVPPDAPARFVVRRAQGYSTKRVDDPAKVQFAQSDPARFQVGLTASKDPVPHLGGPETPQAPRLPVDSAGKPEGFGAAHVQDRRVSGRDATEAANLDVAVGQKTRHPDLNLEHSRGLPNFKRSSARVADHPRDPRTLRLDRGAAEASVDTTDEARFQRPVRRDEVALSGPPDAVRNAAPLSGHVTPVMPPGTANRDDTVGVGRADRLHPDRQVEKLTSRGPEGITQRPLAKASQGGQFVAVAQQGVDADPDPAFKDQMPDVDLQNVRTAERMTSSPSDPLGPQKPSPPPVARQITEAVASVREGQVTLRLSPEELGAVKLSMSMTDAGVTLTVQSERPETLDLIRRHIDQLKSELSSMGLGEVEVGFGGGHDPHQNATHLPDDQDAPKPDTRDPEPDHPKNAGLSGVDLRL